MCKICNRPSTIADNDFDTVHSKCVDRLKAQLAIAVEAMKKAKVSGVLLIDKVLADIRAVK